MPAPCRAHEWHTVTRVAPLRLAFGPGMHLGAAAPLPVEPYKRGINTNDVLRHLREGWLYWLAHLKGQRQVSSLVTGTFGYERLV